MSDYVLMYVFIQEEKHVGVVGQLGTRRSLHVTRRIGVARGDRGWTQMLVVCIGYAFETRMKGG